MSRWIRWEGVGCIIISAFVVRGVTAGAKSFQSFRTSQAIASATAEGAQTHASEPSTQPSAQPTSPSSVSFLDDNPQLRTVSQSALAVNAISNDADLPEALKERYTHIPDVEVWLPVLYEQEDFARLEQVIQELLERDRQDELASAYLGRLYTKLGALQGADYEITESDRDQFKQQLAVLDRWQSAYPESHVPLLVRAILKGRYAWEIRGAGYNHEITDERLVEYGQEIKTALTDIDQAVQINSTDPNLWSHLIDIARCVQGPKILLKYYEQGLKVNPFHVALHAEWIMTLQPQWYGSVEEQLKMAERVTELAEEYDKPLLGSAALLAYRTARKHRKHLFKDSEIKSSINALYERMFERYPEYPRMRFFYAYDAVQMEEYVLALEQFEWIGARWTIAGSWEDLEHFHRIRAQVYHKAAHDAFLKMDAETTQRLADFSYELEPSPSVLLLLAALSGNTDPDMTKVIDYAERALAMDPTAEEKRDALRMIDQAKAMMGR